MFDWLAVDARLLVHAASALYVVAFLVKNQLTLRSIVLVATAMYIAYYYFAPSMPLWEAIWWSVVLGAANVWVMIQLFLERTTFTLSHEQKTLYEQFDTMMPGEFRRLLKIAQWQNVEVSQDLTQEDETCDALHFLLHGQASINKRGRHFQLEAPTFIGEVSYFLARGATASVSAMPGSTVVSWPRADLDRLLKKQPGIRIALHSLLNTDMAIKVAQS
ncbi:MAG: cyclic nucleotide-binding domain-containing protein [Ahrensia sp.]|nr:cyclic nucleotide-binding domain-containing protein [Ahrensia sp.]